MEKQKSTNILVILCVILPIITFIIAFVAGYLIGDNATTAKVSSKDLASANSEYNSIPVTVNDFVKKYNQRTMGEKISKLVDTKLDSGETVKNFVDSSRTLIQFQTGADGNTIKKLVL